MNHQHIRGRALACFLAVFPVLLSGCSATPPGHYMGRQPVPAPEETEFRGRVSLRSIAQDVGERIAGGEDREEIPGPRDAPDAGQPPMVYKVGIHDVLGIVVWNYPELNPGGRVSTAGAGAGTAAGEYLVNAEGNIHFPLAGTVKAEGRSPEEIRRILSRRLSPYLSDPQLSVSVARFRSRDYLLLGEVGKPGKYTITDIPLRVVDALAEAGGPLSGADLARIRLYRRDRGYQLDLDAFYRYGDQGANILLEPGDQLVVPALKPRKVFVVGEVRSPRTLLLPHDRNYSLSEALQDAGGANPMSSDLGRVYVVRGDRQEGQPPGATLYHLSLRDPVALVLADNFQLQERDIVYIDPTGLSMVGRVLQQIAPLLNVARQSQNVVSSLP